MNRRSDDEIARDFDQRMNEGREFEGLRPVKVQTTKSPRAVVSIRLTPDELSRYSRAAAARGVTLSDFLRTAADAACDEKAEVSRSETILELKKQVEDLADTVHRL